VWFYGFIGKFFLNNRGESETISDTQEIVNIFSVPRVSADVSVTSDSSCIVSNSLVEAYWDWEEGGFKMIEIVNPRYHQYSINAAALPKKAVNKNGDVRVRITATKRHYVNVASLFAPQKYMDYDEEKLKVRKVFHNRLSKEQSEVIGKERSGEYVHIIPGDVVDVELDAPSQKVASSDMKESYIFKATGIYTSLSGESRKKAGNWFEKLDDDGKQIYNFLYSDKKKTLL